MQVASNRTIHEGVTIALILILMPSITPTFLNMELIRRGISIKMTINIMMMMAGIHILSLSNRQRIRLLLKSKAT